MVEMHMSYSLNSPLSTSYITVTVDGRRFLRGYRDLYGYQCTPNSDGELVFNENPLKPPKALLGKTLSRLDSTTSETYWVYTHKSGRVAMVKIPKRVESLTLEFKEVCYTPMDVKELILLLEISS